MAYYDLKQKIPRFLSGFALQDGLALGLPLSQSVASERTTTQVVGESPKTENPEISLGICASGWA